MTDEKFAGIGSEAVAAEVARQKAFWSRALGKLKDTLEA